MRAEGLELLLAKVREDAFSHGQCNKDHRAVLGDKRVEICDQVIGIAVGKHETPRSVSLDLANGAFVILTWVKLKYHLLTICDVKYFPDELLPVLVIRCGLVTISTERYCVCSAKCNVLTQTIVVSSHETSAYLHSEPGGSCQGAGVKHGNRNCMRGKKVYDVRLCCPTVPKGSLLIIVALWRIR